MIFVIQAVLQLAVIFIAGYHRDGLKPTSLKQSVKDDLPWLVFVAVVIHGTYWLAGGTYD